MQSSANKKLTRRERDRDAHKEEILDAAEEIFADEGFFGASVKNIAERADFSVGMIYHFFKSKEGLYDAVIGRRMDEAYELGVKAASRAKDPPSMIRMGLETLFTYMEEHRSVVHLLFRETFGFKLRMRGALGDDLSEKYTKFQDYILVVFKEGVEAGHFPDINPLNLMLGYVGIVFSFLAYHLERNPDANLVELIPDIEQVFYEQMRPAK